MPYLSSLDSLLLSAIESSNPHLVRSALTEGANPNARKVVVLRATLQPEGEDVKDAREAENALALAIKSEMVAVVRALIDAGADPSVPLSWPFPAFHPSWSSSLWRSSRWHLTPTFSNALELAVATSYWSNLPGATVVIDDPSSVFETREGVVGEPSLEMVQELLRRPGVVVTNGVLRRAKELAFDAPKGSKRSKILDLVQRATTAAVEQPARLQVTPVHGHGPTSPTTTSTTTTAITTTYLAPTTPPASPPPKRRSLLIPSTWLLPPAPSAQPQSHQNAADEPARPKRRSLLLPSTWLLPSSSSAPTAPTEQPRPAPEEQYYKPNRGVKYTPSFRSRPPRLSHDRSHESDDSPVSVRIASPVAGHRPGSQLLEMPASPTSPTSPTSPLAFNYYNSGTPLASSISAPANLSLFTSGPPTSPLSPTSPTSRPTTPRLVPLTPIPPLPTPPPSLDETSFARQFSAFLAASPVPPEHPYGGSMNRNSGTRRSVTRVGSDMSARKDGSVWGGSKVVMVLEGPAQGRSPTPGSGGAGPAQGGGSHSRTSSGPQVRWAGTASAGGEGGAGAEEMNRRGSFRSGKKGGWFGALFGKGSERGVAVR